LSEKASDIKSFSYSSDCSRQPPFPTSNTPSLGKILLNRHLRSPCRTHRRTRARAGPSPLRRTTTDSFPQIVVPPPVAHCPPSVLNNRDFYSWMDSDKTLCGHNPYDYVNSELRKNRFKVHEMDAMDAIGSILLDHEPIVLSQILSPTASKRNRYAVLPDNVGDVPRVLLSHEVDHLPLSPRPTERSKRQPFAERGQRAPWNGVVGYKKDSDQPVKEKQGRGRGLPRATRPSLRIKNMKENQVPPF